MADHSEDSDLRAEQWSAAQLASFISGPDVIKSLVAAGYSQDRATAIVQHVSHDPATQVAAEFYYKWRKMQSLMRILLESFEHVGIDQAPVELPAGASPGPALTESVFRNRPLVLRGLIREWPMLAEISWASLAERFGSEYVQVSPNTMSPEYYSLGKHDIYDEMKLETFIRRNLLGGESPGYIVLRSRLLDRAPFNQLRNLMEPIPGVNDNPRPTALPPHLWIGPAGTLTPLHHDNRNVVLAQIIGSKRVALLSPRYNESVDTDRYCFSRHREYPLELRDILTPEGVNVDIVELDRADAVMIPVGWWHAVEALSPSISVTLQDLNLDSHWRQPYLGEKGHATELRRLSKPAQFDPELYSPYPQVLD